MFERLMCKKRTQHNMQTVTRKILEPQRKTCIEFFCTVSFRYFCSWRINAGYWVSKSGRHEMLGLISLSTLTQKPILTEFWSIFQRERKKKSKCESSVTICRQSYKTDCLCSSAFPYYSNKVSKELPKKVLFVVVRQKQTSRHERRIFPFEPWVATPKFRGRGTILFSRVSQLLLLYAYNIYT